VNIDLLRHCMMPPHPHKIEPHEIPLRRMERFTGELGRGGLYEAFLRIKNDELVYFADVVDWLVAAVPGLDRGSVVTRFRLSVRYGDFGRKGSLGQIAELIDLDNFSDARPGCYALRPFTTRAMGSCEQMRSCRSRWATWIGGQGWPVPGWLAGAAMIEGGATVTNDGYRTLPAPVADAKGRREYKSTKKDIIAAAARLGKTQADYKTFGEYRRVLIEVAEVNPDARGWSEDTIRRALASQVPQI
jgi:hypothetical protein